MNSLNLAVANLRDKNNDKKVMDLEVIENDIGKLKKQMLEAAENLEFEKAAKLRNKIDKLQKSLLIIS
jgi:excinuclease UvrABC nuclease subunit